MEITAVAPLEGGAQIGGGAGWVADRVRDGLMDAKEALRAAAGTWGRQPIIGPHPREVAIETAREAAAHLNEALTVEAPQDVIDDTRRALAELAVAIDVLEKLPNQAGVAPQERPLQVFARAIEMLERAEQRLTGANWGWG